MSTLAPVPRGALRIWMVGLAVYFLAVFHRSSRAVAGLTASERFDITAAQLSPSRGSSLDSALDDEDEPQDPRLPAPIDVALPASPVRSSLETPTPTAEEPEKILLDDQEEEEEQGQLSTPTPTHTATTMGSKAPSRRQ